MSIGRSGSWFPLSHGQEALWFLWKLVPHTWAYNIPLPVSIRGPFDVVAFRRALQQVSDRHPALRITFCEDGGKPGQRALDDHEVRVEQIDATDWDDIQLETALRDEARRPFDLDSSVVPRTTIFRRSGDHHVLLFVAHHIVSDLWSLIVIMDELRQLYAAATQGHSSSLPALSSSMETHIHEQRLWVASEAGEKLWHYWREELSGELPVLDLPADHTRPATQSFRGATVIRRMRTELTRLLKELAGRERVTPFIALLTAYQVLLHRYTGQEDIIVGSPTSGRERADLQGLVGDFVNMVPIRTDLTGRPTFRQLLARTRAKVVGTIKHQDYPFSLLVDRIHAARDLSRSPIFQTTFVLQKFHRFPELSRVMLPDEHESSPIPFADLVLEPIALGQQEGQFDLNLEMKEDEQGRLVGAWKYATDLFEHATIERMSRHFETLLGEIVAHPDRPISELRLLDERESREAIAMGQGAIVPLPAAATVCQLFEAQAAQRGSSIAVRYGNASLTYSALASRVDSLARRLVTLGIGRDAVVAVLLPRGPDFIAALLAVSKAGGAFLPLDTRHPAARTQRIIEESGAILVLTQERLGELAGVEPSATLPDVDARDLAYLMFTSGSTGKPKGVMVEHRGMVNHVLAKLSDLEMSDEDVLAQNGPPTFDIVVWQCLAPLVTGGRVVVLPDEIAEDPARLLVEVDRCGVTVLQVVPSMLHAVLDERALPLPALRWIVPTGEALPTELCRRWLARYPRIPLLNTYGSTECSDDQCHYVLSRLESADRAVAVTSIGTPIHNMTAHVLDSELRPVPAGIAGELYIGGIGVGRGYLRDPERTATSFVPDPFSTRPGALLYRTRDLARRRSDGRIDFLGRVDTMIKLRGFRIEPGEIEAALTRHPNISAAAVVARANPSGERVLVAYLVTKNPPDADELRRFLAERLPQSMVPSVFCAIDTLPLTANGKLDSKALPQPRWQSTMAEDQIEPRTAAERQMAAIWCAVLGLDRIGVTQDFFAIGGDSIRSIQIVARCMRDGLHISPGDLFQHSTIAALAALAESATDECSDVPALEIAQEHLDLALSQVDFDV